jgi:dTMP kinase
MTDPGKLIVFEGLSGSGKGTQLLLLATTLFKHGSKDLLLTREPTSGRFGQAVKELRAQHKRNGIEPRTAAGEYLRLYTEDAIEHSRVTIAPALAAGQTVLCDRYYHSRLCYQVEEGLSFDHVLSLQKEVVRPDLTLLFDLSPELALQRIDTRGERSQLERLELMTRLRGRYLELPGKLSGENIEVIDASCSVDKVAEQVAGVVARVVF